MAFNLASIKRGSEILAPRILLLGPEKAGKTTFAATAPNALVIPVGQERGVSQLACAKTDSANSYLELLDILNTLCKEKHEFEWVAIDSWSSLEPLIYDHVCKIEAATSIEKVGGGYGKGVIESMKYAREIIGLLDKLQAKGIGTTVIGHVKVKEFNDPETQPYTTYQFDVNDRHSSALYRWADAILFLTLKRSIIKKFEGGYGSETVNAIGTGERVIYTEKRPAHPGGNRYGLPFEIKLPIDAPFAAFEDAMSQSRVVKQTA
ncbi:hypothetical protein BH11ARM1_BH11ARM1_04540 [soil metagenome]